MVITYSHIWYGFLLIYIQIWWVFQNVNLKMLKRDKKLKFDRLFSVISTVAFIGIRRYRPSYRKKEVKVYKKAGFKKIFPNILKMWGFFPRIFSLAKVLVIMRFFLKIKWKSTHLKQKTSNIYQNLESVTLK